MLEEKRLSHGMIGGSSRLLPLLENIERTPLKGHIELTNWTIEIALNTRWDPLRRESIRTFCAENGIKRPIEAAVGAAGEHELKHWKECPSSLFKHTDLLDAVTDELAKQGKKSKSLIRTLVNCFEDIVANAALSDEDRRALFIFYRESAFTPFFAAYMNVQLAVLGNDSDRKLLEKNFAALKPEELRSAQQVANAILRAWGFEGKDQNEMLAALKNSDNWERMVRIFALNVAPLVRMVKAGGSLRGQRSSEEGGGTEAGDESEDEEGEASKEKQKGGSIGEALRNLLKKLGRGKGEKGEEKAKDEKGETGGGKGSEEEEKESEEEEGGEGGSGKGDEESGEKEESAEGAFDTVEEEPEPEEWDPANAADGSREDDEVAEPRSGPGDNPYDKELESDDGLKKLLQGRLDQNKRNGRNAGKAGLPKIVENDRAIELLYELISPEIPIKAEAQEGLAYPCIRHTIEPFDPLEHDPSDVRGVLIDENGEVGLAVKRQKFSINVPLIKGLMGFPNVAWIIDTSGSMFFGTQYDPMFPWPTDCGYHFALQGAVGTQKWLARENILPYIKMLIITFSDTTLSSGWRDFSQSDAIRRALRERQGGGTEINPAVLKEEFVGAEPSLVFLLSDGGIRNWSAVREEVFATLAGHQVAFLRLGGPTETSNDFAARGHPVFPVTKDEHLRELMIDMTKKSFEQLEKEAKERSKALF